MDERKTQMEKRRMARLRLMAMLSLLAAVLFLLPGKALAAGLIDTNRDVSLTIQYRCQEEPLEGAVFCLYRVADVTAAGEFQLTGAFTGSGASFTDLDQEGWQSLADTLAEYAETHSEEAVPCDSGVTDSAGNLTFPAQAGTLMPGLYLVTGDQLTTESTVYTPGNFLISLPDQDEEGNWEYDVTASPKCRAEDLVTERTVQKVWKDTGYEKKRPSEIQVSLLHNGEIYDTVTLNAANNWKYTWEGLSAAGRWTVKETEVPSGYQAAVTADGKRLILTNTYVPPSGSNTPGSKLPQTGMLWWPVPVLAGAGLVCCLIGWVRRRRNEGSHEES